MVTAPGVLNCTANLRINGVLAPVPFSLRLAYPEPRIERTVSGGRMAARRYGHRVVIQWGEAYAHADEIAALRRMLYPGALTLDWDEPNGDTFSFRVLREKWTTSWSWLYPGFYQPLIVTFRERPPVASP